jgi:hypothetical protein
VPVVNRNGGVRAKRRPAVESVAPLHNPRRSRRCRAPFQPTEEQKPMNKLLIALVTAAFAASPVLAQTTAPAKDEKKAEAKKDEKKAEATKDEPKAAEAKKEEKKKPKGGC